MPVSSSSVLTWSLRALAGAVETGSRLLARVGTVSGCGSRPPEQRLAEVAGAVVSSSAPQQPPSTPTVAGRAGGTVATSKAQGQRAVPARAATASVTPATVRSWAHERGIQVSDRGRIPRSSWSSTWPRWCGQRPVVAGPAEPPPRGHAPHPAVPAPPRPDLLLGTRRPYIVMSGRIHRRGSAAYRGCAREA